MFQEPKLAMKNWLSFTMKLLQSMQNLLLRELTQVTFFSYVYLVKSVLIFNQIDWTLIVFLQRFKYNIRKKCPSKNVKNQNLKINVKT